MSMSVGKIEAVDFDTVYKVLSSRKLSEVDKSKFIKANSTKIKDILKNNITSADFDKLMDNRHIVKFKPLKNSFTKYGDKIILAKSLGVPTSEIPNYIRNVNDAMKTVDKLTFLPSDKLEQIKRYVYRHGNKDELVNFLDYELKNAEDIVKTLYRTLEYHTGGVADYFIRPIHRLDNKTMIRIYNIIDKNLDNAQKSGNINQEQQDKIARWALVQIYKIQNNNKLINAIKTVKTLNG